MSEQYFLITCSEDGEVRVRQYSKEELLTTLAAGDHGKIDFFGKVPAVDPMNWNTGKCLLIKGEIAVPYPKTTTVAYDVR